jgi:hypothetical protein
MFITVNENLSYLPYEQQYNKLVYRLKYRPVVSYDRINFDDALHINLHTFFVTFSLLGLYNELNHSQVSLSIK